MDVGGLNGDQWLPSLKASGEWDGKQYSTPFYAANRMVVYRTDMFQQAGISSPPTSRDEWLDAIAKLPSREVLYGRLVGMVASPLTGLGAAMGALGS